MFDATDGWYEAIARSRPPKDQPWYRVLMHHATHETYVAERNREPDASSAPVRHPLVDTFSRNFSDGHYFNGRTNELMVSGAGYRSNTAVNVFLPAIFTLAVLTGL